MKYGIRKEEKVCGTRSKWKITMENEVELLKNQINMLNGQLLHYSNRLIRLEKSNFLKDVQSRPKIPSIQPHKNAKRHEFTPKLFGPFSYASQGVDYTQHSQSFHPGDGSFEKKNANLPGEESPSVKRYQHSKQESMLAQVLTQLGKMDNKMTEMNNHLTSLDYQLSEVCPRLSVMDSRLSAVDMFITMQRFNQKWKGLEPRLESLNVTDTTFEDCEVEAKSVGNTTQIDLRHPDKKCLSSSVDRSFANAEESLETNKDSCPVTKTNQGEIKQVLNNTQSTLSHTSTPVANNKLENCAVDFNEEETKLSANFYSQELNKQLEDNTMSTCINNSGERIVSNCVNKGDTLKNIANNDINDSQQVNNNVGKCAVDFKEKDTKPSSTMHSSVENAVNCVDKADIKEKNNDCIEKDDSQTKQSGIQAEIDSIQIEQINAMGSGGSESENILVLPSLEGTNAKSVIKADMLPSPEDGEDDFVIINNLDVQEITQAVTNLNCEPLKIYHDITEYLEINMGKKKNEVYEFGFEAKDDSFINFKDNMVTNDSKSVKQSSPTLLNQIPPIPIPTTQISSESKINKTGKEIQGRQISPDQ